MVAARVAWMERSVLNSIGLEFEQPMAGPKGRIHGCIL